MSLRDIINPMNFDLVKAAIASLLVRERDNQVALLDAAGKTADEIDNNYYFNVFKDMYRFPDVAELPCVNVYNADGDFTAGVAQSTLSRKWHTFSLAVDCYSVSTAEGDDNADKLCAARLDYLWSQVFHSLMSEENYYAGLSSIIRKKRVTRWEQKRDNTRDETAEVVLAIQSTFEFQFNENVELITGEPWEELVASLGIDDQFINPFMTLQIGN